MIKARKQEIKATEEAWVEIAKLKESFCIELTDMKEDSRVRIHWLWNDLVSARKENRWLWDELHQACN